MNWDMLGHEWAVSLLKEHIAQGNLRHAYLFTGSQGLGRRTLALRLAQALNCTNPPAPGVPCRACPDCIQIERMQHPDLAIVEADQKGGTLKVDQIRELQRSLSLAPYQARYRVAVLLRFEEANPNAANALLKTLEEPAPQVIMMITAESSESLLPTIVSRCEVLRLRPLSLETTAQGLQARWGLPPEEARLLAHLSGGRPGYALHLHQSPEQMEARISWLNDHFHLLKANRVERFAYAESLARDRDRLRGTLQVWLSLWHDVLLRTSGSTVPLANLDCSEQIDSLSAHCDLNISYQMVSNLERTFELLEHNVNARLAVEVLMLDLPTYRFVN